MRKNEKRRVVTYCLFLWEGEKRLDQRGRRYQLISDKIQRPKLFQVSALIRRYLIDIYREERMRKTRCYVPPFSPGWKKCVGQKGRPYQLICL